MDRRLLANALDEWMTTGYHHLLETQKHKRGQHLLKTYLIEANHFENGNGSVEVARFFETNKTPVPIEISATEDPTIHHVYVGQTRTPFFLDTLDKRFWTMHSVAPATQSDNAMRNLILRTRNLDSFWLPSQQFEEWIGLIGVPRVLTSKFSVSTGIYRDTIPEDQFVNDSLVFKIGASGDVRERLELYRESPIMASQLALWSASVVRRWTEGDHVTTSTVTAAGKITARGNSFRLHEEIVNGLRQKYADLVVEWERRFQLRWNDDDGRLSPSGETAFIEFPEELSPDRLTQVIGTLFNCTEPFRLLGTPVLNGGSTRYVIKGVDLHTGHKVDFEITPRFIRVYLGRTTCGNVLARLVTNLQHYVDARIKLT